MKYEWQAKIVNKTNTCELFENAVRTFGIIALLIQIYFMSELPECEEGA